MDNIVQALAVTVFGILIVFSVLIILMVILNVMKLFAPSAEDEAKPEPEVAPVEVQEKTEDDCEIIAVLTAAVAASLGVKSSGLVIKSYKRLY